VSSVFSSSYAEDWVLNTFFDVARFVFLRDVWIQTHGAAVASRRATSLATHLANLANHPPDLATHLSDLATHIPDLATNFPDLVPISLT
jgi:hypothetical protein